MVEKNFEILRSNLEELCDYAKQPIMTDCNIDRITYLLSNIAAGVDDWGIQDTIALMTWIVQLARDEITELQFFNKFYQIGLRLVIIND